METEWIFDMQLKLTTVEGFNLQVVTFFLGQG